MRILCLGAGAVGGYFGGRLAESGVDVTFLVRPARQSQMAGRLRIESCFGNADIAVRTETRETAVGPYDVVLLTSKAYDLSSSIDAIAPFVGPDTMVLPLLNGVAHMDALNARFGRERVWGGVAKIAATVAPGGTIRHLNDWRFVTFGEQDGEMTARVERLKAAFDGTSVIAKAVPDIMQVMWEKIVHLTTVAGATCLMRASVGEIACTDHGSAFMIELLNKNAKISAKEGYVPSEVFLEEYRKLFRDRTSGYTASMLRDILRGGAIEADHVIGFMLRKAEQHGIDPTLHNLIFTHLQAYEQNRSRNARA